MKVLVNGANGFVGRVLCPYLMRRGHAVIPVVRRASGVAGECIVSNEFPVERALNNCDVVVHLIGRAHVMKDSELNPHKAYRSSNVDPALGLAKCAVEAGVRRFILLSSIKVNGERTVPGLSFKADDPVAPQDFYAASKWEAEQGIHAIAKGTDLEVTIVRPPLIYGPGVKGNFASLLKWLKWGLPLPLGNVDNLRSMIALENLMDFLALLIDINRSPNAKGQTFLVSDGEDISTTALLHRIAKAYDFNLRLLPAPVILTRFLAQIMGQSLLVERLFGSLVVDSSKTEAVLGWRAPVRMEDQLEKMANVAAV